MGKTRVRQQDEYRARVDALVPRAAAAADLACPSGAASDASAEDAAEWTRVYHAAMDQLCESDGARRRRRRPDGPHVAAHAFARAALRPESRSEEAAS